MRLLWRTKGQSILELTLITPLLLVALYVPFDFGIAIFAGYLTQNTARDGARIASRTRALNDTAAVSVATQVFGTMPNLLTNPNKQVTVRYYSGTPANCVEFVEVVARGTYNYTLYRFIAFVGLTPPAPRLVTRTTRVQYEYQPFQNGGLSTTTTFCSTAMPTATGTYP